VWWFGIFKRLEHPNAMRTSVAGEGLTEPLLYLSKAQMQPSLAGGAKTTMPHSGCGGLAFSFDFSVFYLLMLPFSFHMC